MSDTDLVEISEFSLQEFQGIGITNQEINFVHHFVKGGGQPDMAAAQAGYSPKHGFVLVKQLKILEAIRRYTLMEFQIDAVAARQVLVDVMQDIKTPAMVKRQCAKDILDIANLAGGTLMPAGGNQLSMDISKLTEPEKDELERLLAKTCRDPGASNSNVVDVDFKEVKNGGKKQTG